MAFFDNFPKRWHELPNGDKVLLCNLTRAVALDPAVKKNQTILLQYDIEQNERPEVISYRLYDTTDYWWLVLMVNDIIDVSKQWPLSDVELEQYVSKKYEDPEGIHHWVDGDGIVTDPRAAMVFGGFNTIYEAADAYSLAPVSNIDHEIGLNNAKKSIKLIDPAYIDKIGQQVQELMQND